MPGELRTRVIDFVEEGGSRREAADQFEVSVSSAIRWVQRFREDGTCEPMPRARHSQSTDAQAPSPFARASPSVMAQSVPTPSFQRGDFVMPQSPVDNTQASLALTQASVTIGVFPPHDGGAGGAFLDEIFTFAFNFAPGGSAAKRVSSAGWLRHYLAASAATNLYHPRFTRALAL
jgi:hypothetical protein